MRRGRQLLSEDDTRNILLNSSNGIISLVDPDGYPYGVPVSFAYDGRSHIYIHSAVSGYKIDCIASDPRCSFCVVGQDRIIPDKFTSYFRSVIVRGKLKFVSDPDEIMKGLLLLCEKYSPGISPESEISKCIGHVAVIRLDIESMTGKEAIELVRERSSNI